MYMLNMHKTKGKVSMVDIIDFL